MLTTLDVLIVLSAIGRLVAILKFLDYIMHSKKPFLCMKKRLLYIIEVGALLCNDILIIFKPRYAKLPLILPRYKISVQTIPLA